MTGYYTRFWILVSQHIQNDTTDTLIPTCLHHLMAYLFFYKKCKKKYICLTHVCMLFPGYLEVVIGIRMNNNMSTGAETLRKKEVYQFVFYGVVRKGSSCEWSE